ncbi:MAG: CPBP family intramembrane metalloprotease, partial [Gemmiger sp.]|nr:CPBP family intramembrane metalloprotease [Gemmiger sp.]
MMENNQPTKLLADKSMRVYLLVAFGLPYLMAIPLGISQRAGNPTDVFANEQMLYPAAGVILGLLLYSNAKETLPKRFFIAYLAVTAVAAIMAVGSVFAPALPWTAFISYLLIVGSVVGGILLLTEKKEKRTPHGLRGKNWKLSFLMILLFFVLYAGRDIASVVLAGQWGEFATYLQTGSPFILL